MIAFNTIGVLVLSLVLVSGSEQCLAMVEKWKDQPMSLPSITYVDSGKFLNDLGDYNNCLFHKDEFAYLTLKVVNKLVGYQYMGFCSPLYCKDQLINGNLATIFQDSLNQIYQKLTKTTTAPFVGAMFYDPQQTTPVINWSNYLVFALLGAIIIFEVIASIVAKVSTSQSTAIKTIKCFSAYDNIKKILIIAPTTQNQNLLFLNGVRVLSIFWIAFGHDLWMRFMNLKNWLQTMNIITSPGLATLGVAAYFAVDTFFWLGAFLVTIGMIPQLQKSQNFIKFYFGCVVHRLIRIWPTYMLAILIYWKVAPVLGSGPIWLSFQEVTNSCNNGGVLWNMFFIDNFQDHGPSGMDYCFGWGWYLAVDFQLFLISPFIIYAYVKNKKIGLIVNSIVFVASIITAFILVIVNDWRYPIPSAKYKPQPQFMDQFYYRPYIRASVYTMGIFTGFLYYEWQNNNEDVVRVINKIKNNIPIRIMLYVIGITLCELVIWIVVPYQKGQNWSTTAQAFYNSLNRVFFLLGMFMCVFAAMFGVKNDPVKFILGHSFFAPLAKVSFCIYLTHLIVIMNGTFSARMQLYWQTMSIIYMVLSDIFWATLLATCLSVMIQSPTLGLEKLFLKPPKHKSMLAETPELKIEFKADDSQLNQPLNPNNESSAQRSSVSAMRITETLL